MATGDIINISATDLGGSVLFYWTPEVVPGTG
jgi:hypothetical protein